MSFEINRGLGRFNSGKDYHAALGLSLGASATDIRKRYLKIARTLHPDSRSQDDSQQLASQLLSKLVNPAYQLLSQEKEREEYEVILRLLGQQLVSGQIPLNQSNPAVKAIMTDPDYQATYAKSLEALANQQYENLIVSMEMTGQISELNLAFLWRQHGGHPTATPMPLPSMTTPATSAPSTLPTSTMAPSAAPGSPASASKSTHGSTDQYTEQYYRRAEEFFRKNSYQQVIKELRDALKLNPNSSRCHALTGQAYLKLGQVTMAKVSFRRALELNPQEAQAVTGMETITKAERRAQQKAKQTIPPKPESGGLFGNLFKKKDK